MSRMLSSDRQNATPMNEGARRAAACAVVLITGAITVSVCWLVAEVSFDGTGADLALWLWHASPFVVVALGALVGASFTVLAFGTATAAIGTIAAFGYVLMNDSSTAGLFLPLSPFFILIAVGIALGLAASE